MKTTKFIFTLALMFGLLFTQARSAAAAPAQDTTPITGTITSVTCETDSGGTNTFLVTFDGTTTVRISQQSAIDLGLVTADGTGNVDCASDAVKGELLADSGKTDVSIDQSQVIPDQTQEESVNPISAILGKFFDTDASVIDGYHKDGFGFGVIAQALWISGGDASLTGDILQAKQEKSFTDFFDAHPELLPDGATVPTNWGQFKKLLSGEKHNLGVIVSGHGNTDTNNEHGNGNGNDNNGNGHGNGNGNGNNGNGKGNGN